MNPNVQTQVQGGAPLIDLPHLHWAKAITHANFKSVPTSASGNLATNLAAKLLATASGTSTKAIQFASASAPLVTLTDKATEAWEMCWSATAPPGFPAAADKVIKLPDGATAGVGSFMM